MRNPRFRSTSLSFLFVSMAVAGPAVAVEPVPISAEAAFDAVATQTDPLGGYATKVALVDVRSRAEYFWVGAPTRVDAIVKKDGSVIEPDLGKVTMSGTGAFLNFSSDGDAKILLVTQIDRIDLSPIAENIPFKLWNEEIAKLEENAGFASGIASLLQEGVQVVILFCRSGGRSTACVGDVAAAPIFEQFLEVYEIDDPAGGRGGFEGTSYGNVYNGYRGYPGRLTQLQEAPSVSWKDSGLPMKTSINPLK